MWDTIVIQPFTNVLLLITLLVKNFGIAIILFTALIKLATHPLTVKQFKATQKMQEIQNDPRMKKFQEKYKNDKERLQQEQMKLYQEYKINPLGSCLPTLIQFPIIIGLYQTITRAMAATPYELLKLERIFYPFLDPTKLLPLQNRFLWMDLGQPERLPMFGIEIPVLAIIVVITTYLQSRLIQPPANANDQGAAFSKAMNLYMPVLMGWMAWSLASGLALYFLASNIFGIVQYALLGRANWRNLLPFLKKKDDEGVKVLPTQQQKAVDVKPVEIDDDDDDEKGSSQEPGMRARPNMKQYRPKLKKNK